METVDPSTITSLPTSPAKAHKLVYRWTCRRLNSVWDDDPEGTAGNVDPKEKKSVAGALEVCDGNAGFVPAVDIPIGVPPGVYVTKNIK